ncbi:HD domain-containing protein [bacterium]|nr:HD domain-containing protein [bacterium]
MDKLHFPIHPQTLRIDTIRSFDIFSEGESGEMKLYHRAGENYTAKDHAKIFKMNVSALFVKNSERGRYYKYLETNISDIIDDPLLNATSKAEIIHSLLIAQAMTLFDSPGEEIINKYKESIKLTVDFIIKEENAIRYLIQSSTSSHHLFNHVVNVGIFGLGLAREVLPGDSSHDMNEIAAGLFLHDIGRFTIPKYFNTRKGPLSSEEWEIMKKHPEEGFKILKKFNALSDEITVIVWQHHERHNGTGYPAGLRGNSIHTYSKICSISDTFDALTSHRPYRPGKSSFNALAIMQNEMKGEFDPKFFAQFVKIFSRQ